jgi:hypothetical protein
VDAGGVAAGVGGVAVQGKEVGKVEQVKVEALAVERTVIAVQASEDGRDAVARVVAVAATAVHDAHMQKTNTIYD